MQDIFNIKTEQDFKSACLETFHYQYNSVAVYKDFVDYLKISPSDVREVEDILFLPIEMFKNHQILDKSKAAERYF